MGQTRPAGRHAKRREPRPLIAQPGRRLGQQDGREPRCFPGASGRRKPRHLPKQRDRGVGVQHGDHPVGRTGLSPEPEWAPLPEQLSAHSPPDDSDGHGERADRRCRERPLRRHGLHGSRLLPGRLASAPDALAADVRAALRPHRPPSLHELRDSVRAVSLPAPDEPDPAGPRDRLQQARTCPARSGMGDDRRRVAEDPGGPRRRTPRADGFGAGQDA